MESGITRVLFDRITQTERSEACPAFGGQLDGRAAIRTVELHASYGKPTRTAFKRKRVSRPKRPSVVIPGSHPPRRLLRMPVA